MKNENSKMRDFSNVVEKDSVRLIIAKDLKELGIDVEITTHETNRHLSITTNTINNNLSQHNHSLSLKTISSGGGGGHHTFHMFQSSKSSNHHHNKSNISANLMSDNAVGISCTQSDSQLSGGAFKVFGVSLKQLEMSTITVNEQSLMVPTYALRPFLTLSSIYLSLFYMCLAS